MATTGDILNGKIGHDTKMNFPLTKSQWSAWYTAFYESPQNRLAQNVCTARDPINACLRSLADLSSEVSGEKTWHDVDTQGKATTGGPGWICTGLDLLRQEMDRKMPLPVDFELSAGHLFFWHKLERCNYFLWTVADLLRQCQPLDGRCFRHLMKNAIPDGGNWQMFVNLVKKYGVMPKKCYLSTQRIRKMNKILRSKLHEYASMLHAQFTFNGNGNRLPELIQDMIPHLFNVVSICLGEPPEVFNWTFYDHKKRYQSLNNLTSVHFYEVLVASTVDVDAFVCLGHDPRMSSSSQNNYQISHSSNMIGGEPHRYNNQSMDVIMQIIVDSLAGGKPVWLGCDLRSQFAGKSEPLSLKSHKFDLVFGFEVGMSLTKAERLVYKDSRRDAALLLTSVGMDSLKQHVQFRTFGASVIGSRSSTLSINEAVEGDNKKKKDNEELKKKSAKSKAVSMDADWMREYAFEIVVHEKFVPPGVLHASRIQHFKELPAWEPMGALLK
ncbi:bleomycin hydrolase [Drosophila rhopaloa]|uniref:Bleomycin hydrolase n=1 Tax=Drosophila rhopaloa TaxID=1041015 RepID=A0A6P4FJC5_DRORH|nr:bleomycin hydrolase [Drosophila rhopaloa]